MKKINLINILLVSLAMVSMSGCGGSGSSDSSGTSSNTQVPVGTVTHSEGKCLPLIIELISSSQGINEYKIVTDVQDNTEFVTVDLRVSEAVATEASRSGERQLKWQVSAIEKDATLYFKRSDTGCTETVNLKGFGPYLVDYDGTYKGTVTSNCEANVQATLKVKDDVVTGSTTDGYNISGLKLSKNRVSGVSNGGITWDGIISGSTMTGTWRDKEGCHGNFSLNKQR